MKTELQIFKFPPEILTLSKGSKLKMLFFSLLLIAMTFQFGNNCNAQTVGDVMPFYDASSSEYYVYYLRNIWDDATNQRHPWNALTTTNCTAYTEIGEKLSCSTDPCKQDFAIGTGSVIKNGSTYYAFYTGHNPNSPSSCITTKEGVMLATSTGASTAFSKSTSFATIYAPSGYDAADNFRDPYVFLDGSTYYMLVAARTTVNGTWKGVISKYTSTNLTSWNYVGILYDGGSDNYFMMECPQIFKIGSTYYLTFSYTDTKNVYYRKSSTVNGTWSKPVGTEILSGVGYSARTASNGLATYIWGWQVNGTTWAGQLLGNQLIQDSNGDLVVTSITSNVPVTGVSVSPTTAVINVSGTQQLTATVAPSNATNQTVSWSSSNTSIASVNSSGLVTGVAAGTVTITAMTQDGGKTATCAVTVNTTTVSVTGVSVSPTTAAINVGAAQQLTATFAPSNATNQTVTWSSSNTSIATVSSSGIVTGVAAGTATITVTTQDGAKTATCSVTASASSGIVAGTYQIIARHSGKVMDADQGGAVNGAVVQQWDNLDGENQNWNVVPTSPTGYYTITSVSGGKVIDSDGSANGAKIQVWSNLGGDNQKWQIVDLGNGYFNILSKRVSGRAIEVTGSSLNNGARLELADYTGGTQQQWNFVLQALKSALLISSEYPVDASSKLFVYPNPVKDIFYINLSSFKRDKDIVVEITDISGKRIKHLKATADNYSFSSKDLGMNSGLYFIKAQSENKILSAKILIE